MFVDFLSEKANPFVGFDEDLYRKLFYYLREKGFTPSTYWREALHVDRDDNDESCIAIILPQLLPRKLGFITELFCRPRRVFLGSIWFNREKWIFDFFGRKNLLTAQQIASDIQEDFGVEIVINMQDDVPWWEKLDGDW